jgi:three-Cys-motif partner protein
MKGKDVKLDEVGYWSEIKLEILSQYATAYSQILAAQPNLKHYYIDAFSGAGQHVSKISKETVLGSPLRALNVRPPFKGLFFIDMDGDKLELLRKNIGNDRRVQLFEGDCNIVLKDKILPQIKFTDFKRALCLLDPYGVQLKWEVIELAGKSKTIDIFLNFSIMDINMNAALKNPNKAQKQNLDRITAFLGEGWKDAAYKPDPNLDLFEERMVKTDNSAIVKWFQKRLKEVAGFEYVPDPLPMKNSTGAVVYYLFFASHKETGSNIAKSIFKKHEH